jgi:hypothetical protein
MKHTLAKKGIWLLGQSFVCISMDDIQRATFENPVVLEDYSSLYHHEAFWNSSLQCFRDASANHIFPLQAFSCTQCMAFCTVPILCNVFSLKDTAV